MITRGSRRKPYSYDSRCEDLAEIFLADRSHSQRDICELAQAIQDTIESFKPSGVAPTSDTSHA